MRYRHYLEQDVLSAAQQRMRTIFDLHDSVVVLLSGGKDSVCVTELAREEAARRGQLPLDVVFRDEELIHDSVVTTMEHYRQQPWCRLQWWCAPLKSSCYILGKTREYVQWDPQRAWVRSKPAWALIPEDPSLVLDQAESDGFFARPFKGQVAFVNGIRAAESLTRFRSCVAKLNLNYICRSSDPRVQLCKPIYDWEEGDVLKFIQERGLPCSGIYEAQFRARIPLRVSTPVHAEAAKKLDHLREIDPVLYERALGLFPDLQAQERYWKDYDPSRALRAYQGGWEGCMRYIEEQIEGDDQQTLAYQRFTEHRQMAQAQPASYTPEDLLKQLASGAYKRFLVGAPTLGTKPRVRRRRSHLRK